LIFLSFPKGVLGGFHEIIDDLSFVTLITIFFLFFCAVIGIYSRRINAGGAGPVKSTSIFR